MSLRHQMGFTIEAGQVMTLALVPDEPESVRGRLIAMARGVPILRRPDESQRHMESNVE